MTSGPTPNRTSDRISAGGLRFGYPPRTPTNVRTNGLTKKNSPLAEICDLATARESSPKQPQLGRTDAMTRPELEPYAPPTHRVAARETAEQRLAENRAAIAAARARRLARERELEALQGEGPSRVAVGTGWPAT